MNKLSDIEIREILAFEFYMKFDVGAEEGRASKWRGEDTTQRKLWRKFTQAFIEQMDAKGISIRVSSTPKAAAALEDIITIPQKVAYELHSDTE